MATVIHRINVSEMLQVFQEVPKGELPESTQVRLRIDDTMPWPYSMRVALLHLATDGLFSNIDTFHEFRSQLEADKVDITGFVLDWAQVLDKDADVWKIVKYVFSSPKTVVDQPPESVCPRCGNPIWRRSFEDSKQQVADSYRLNPTPVFCIKCGQRFKYDDAARICYTAAQNAEKRRQELAVILKASSQPSISDVMSDEAEREKALQDA